VFRAAAEAMGIACPEVDYKLEGVHDGAWTLTSGADSLEMGSDLFMDGRRFDAGQLQDYLAGFAISRAPVARLDGEAAASGAAQDRTGTAI